MPKSGTDVSFVTAFIESVVLLDECRFPYLQCVHDSAGTDGRIHYPVHLLHRKIGLRDIWYKFLEMHTQ